MARLVREHIRPTSSLWFYQGIDPRSGAHVYDHVAGYRILSAVEEAGNGPEFHVSISKSGVRLSSQEAREVLLGLDTHFPVEQWDEDNHLSSVARNFWAHTDPTKRRPCACKANERPTVEGDFTWRK